MSSIGTGYDLDCTTFSPDGRVFQVEYATKAVDNSGTAIGFVCKNGVVLAVEKLLHSKLLVPGTSRRVHAVDDHIGLAASGLVTDARKLVKQARKEAEDWRRYYNEPIPAKVLADRVAAFTQLYTLYYSLRPFGCSLLIASSTDAVDKAEDSGSEMKDAPACKRKPVLYSIDPSGACTGMFAAAVGKARQAAKTELEKLLPTARSSLDCRNALVQAAKVLLTVHDETKDKNYEIEMSWISEETDWKTQIVPDDIREAAIAEAKQMIAASQ